MNTVRFVVFLIKRMSNAAKHVLISAVVLAVVIAAVVVYSSLTGDDPTVRNPVAQRTDTEPAPAATTKSRPPYCAAYDQWVGARVAMDAIERRQTSTNVNDWSANDFEKWLAKADRFSRAANEANALTPPGVYVTSDSVRRACEAAAAPTTGALSCDQWETTTSEYLVQGFELGQSMVEILSQDRPYDDFGNPIAEEDEFRSTFKRFDTLVERLETIVIKLEQCELLHYTKWEIGEDTKSLRNIVDLVNETCAENGWSCLPPTTTATTKATTTTRKATITASQSKSCERQAASIVFNAGEVAIAVDQAVTAALGGIYARMESEWGAADHFLSKAEREFKAFVLDCQALYPQETAEAKEGLASLRRNVNDLAAECRAVGRDC